MDNTELINKIQRGDSAAFKFLYQKYNSKVYQFTKLYVLSKNDAEEVVQEVFIKLWEQRETLSEIKNIDNYLFILSRNLIFNLSRKKINRDFLKLTIDKALFVENKTDVFEDIIYSDLKRQIYSLVNKLPKRQRDVFLLSRESCLTNKEIAQRLDISVKTVERHMTEALKTLREKCPSIIFVLGLVDFFV